MEDAALWWDIATTRLNVFRKYKTVARAHLNFPDKIEEHMLNFEDDVYPGMRPRIGALWHHLAELKSAKVRDAKEDKPRWNRALEAIAGLQENDANLATHQRLQEDRIRMLEDKIRTVECKLQALENKTL